ncbi:hypothetical protein CK203_039676 [Vitis vinifera]|uniref:Uncharacterized protein n=1 Tax=Vitis vinifera TaxID=29760 RepID=A0A438HFN6_VITVI|nr:hypothetical protein CK203_039676 [Vitis vinifera]
MKSYVFRCLHQALLTTDNLEVSERTLGKTRGNISGKAKFLSNEQEIQPEERPPLVCHAQEDENSDSTSISAKTRHNRRSQLSM